MHREELLALCSRVLATSSCSPPWQLTPSSSSSPVQCGRPSAAPGCGHENTIIHCFRKLQNQVGIHGFEKVIKTKRQYRYFPSHESLPVPTMRLKVTLLNLMPRTTCSLSN